MKSCKSALPGCGHAIIHSKLWLFPWLCLVKVSVAPVDYYFIMLGQTSINIHQNVPICVPLWMEETQKTQRVRNTCREVTGGCVGDTGVLFWMCWKYCISCGAWSNYQARPLKNSLLETLAIIRAIFLNLGNRLLKIRWSQWIWLLKLETAEVILVFIVTWELLNFSQRA